MSTVTFISKVGIFFLFASIYLESLPFSFETIIGRIRPNTIIVVILTYLMLLNYFMIGRGKIKIYKPVFFLSIYITVNILSLMKSASLTMSLRIIFLLISWLLIYVYLIHFFSSKKIAIDTVKIFLFFGVIQALMGMVQILGVFERPTATMGSGDSDYFGLVMMGNLLIFSILKVFKIRIFGKRLDYIFLFLLLINLYFSFVRSAWLGYLTGFVFFLSVLFFRILGKTTVNKKKTLFILCVVVFAVYLIFLLSPSLHEYFNTRLSLSATGNYSIKENIRYEMMKHSLKNALSSPVIGNGPAAFASQGNELNILYGRGVPFDPSILTTLLNDTGILGVFTFLMFLWIFFTDVFSTFKANPNNVLAKYAVAFSIAVFGLLISYIFTNGLWLPFSWIFFGLTTSLAAIARKQNMLENAANR